MGSKVNYSVIGSILVFCLLVFTVFAATSTNTEFKIEPNTLFVDWEDRSDVSCYSNNITFSNDAGIPGYPYYIIVDNSTNSGITTYGSFIVHNGTAYSNLVGLTSAGSKNIALMFSSPASPGNYSDTLFVHEDGDMLENTTITVNLTKQEALQDLISAGDIPKVNIGKTDTIEQAFTINNENEYPLTIQDIKNTTYLRSGNYNVSYVHNLTVGEVIPKKSNKTYQADITVNPLYAGTTHRVFEGDIKITTTDGCPNQTYNLTLSANLTTHLDVAVTANSSLTTNRNQNISVGVTPKYVDGSSIDGLVKANFTARFIHVNLTGSTHSGTVVSAEDKGAYYNVTVTVPSTVLGGEHKVEITVKDGLGSTQNNTGIGYFESFSVQRPALDLETDCNDKTVEVDDSFGCEQTIYNYGSVAATGVNLSYSGCSDYITASTGNDGEIGEILGNDYKSDSASFTAVAATDTNGCTLTISGESSGGTSDWYDRTESPTIIVTAESDDSNDGGGDDPGGGGSSHKLTVTPPATFEIEQGGATSKTVSVKNTGTYTERNVELTLSIDSSWYDVNTEAQVIIPTYSEEYEVDFDIPDNAEPITYTITYTAEGDDAEATATSDMKVLPSEETEQEIEANLTEYREWFGDVMRLFNETKLTGGNMTEVESILEQVTGLLTQADSHIKLGEYFEAYDALKQVRELLTQAENELTAEKGFFEGIMFDKFVLLAAGIVVVAVIAGFYFYTRGRGYRFKPKGPKIGFKGRQKVAGFKLKMEEASRNFKRKLKNIRLRGS